MKIFRILIIHHMTSLRARAPVGASTCVPYFSKFLHFFPWLPTFEINDMNLFSYLIVDGGGCLLYFLLFFCSFLLDNEKGRFYDTTSFYCANLQSQGNTFLKKYLQHKGKLTIKINKAFNHSCRGFLLKVAYAKLSMASYVVEAAKC